MRGIYIASYAYPVRGFGGFLALTYLYIKVGVSYQKRGRGGK
jgi:hypothetical protein